MISNVFPFIKENCICVCVCVCGSIEYVAKQLLYEIGGIIMRVYLCLVTNFQQFDLCIFCLCMRALVMLLFSLLLLYHPLYVIVYTHDLLCQMLSSKVLITFPAVSPISELTFPNSMTSSRLHT